MRLAVVWLLLSSCGPVLLGEEQPGPTGAAGSTSQSAMPIDASTPRDAPAVPSVAVHIKPVDCGKCFELQAEGSGGQPPYAFEWEDGSLRAQRLVCVDSATLLVIARDAAGVRSAPQAIQLQRAPDAACPPPAQPNKPAPRPKLCLKNPSFEGTPAANFGQEQAFDAAPWSTCTNPDAINTPDIGNDTVAQTLGLIPKPTEGDTFLALGEGEQVSQAFCSALPDDDQPVYLQLDLTRLNIGAGLVPETEQVFLEIWGGLSVDCSRRELLWASPPLEPSWKTFCVPLRPRAFLTQLTLRGAADMSLPSPAYLLVDNLKPVEACP
ncbi:MAG TPA: hypothetical protein VJV78_47690 [Polyangiales bacterium]|nr:hypothetical protein [Polyangiales bacterium]